jgi:hypothetical protein
MAARHLITNSLGISRRASPGDLGGGKCLGVAKSPLHYPSVASMHDRATDMSSSGVVEVDSRHIDPTIRQPQRGQFRTRTRDQGGGAL